MNFIRYQLCLLFSWLHCVVVMAQVQATFNQNQDQLWKLTLSKDWDVLGPFPIHAREQQFLSPSFPIDLLEPIDWQRKWSSAYADNAVVEWSKTQLSDDGVLEVSFPQVRWENLRRTEGWSVLQHHAVLRGTITLTPPRVTNSTMTPLRLLVQLKQGSYFTIIPANSTQRGDLVPQWYAGNIYDMERALPRAVDLPVILDPTASTQFHIFISGDYEIRLFGDPRRQKTEIPTQVISLTMDIEYIHNVIRHESSQDVLCDFVDGRAFGDAIGVAYRSVGDWTTVTHVSSKHPELQLQLKHSTRIAPSQLRVVPLSIAQNAPFYGNRLELVVTVLQESSEQSHISISLPISQREAASLHEYTGLTATYFFGNTIPTAFLAVPPTGHPQTAHPPILALHGAGVDIINQPFWAQSLPNNNRSWAILPTGRTSWGLDWHGPSAQNAWECVDALSHILKHSPWKETAFEAGTPVILLGHSNGGQGVWYLGSRYPDRVLALVPAAGYIKSQAYVPLTMSRSAHFIDPALRAVLETSLTPDDNDLFLTNIASKPALAIHGGEDDNVPVWHGREYVSVMETWALIHGFKSNITFKEDKGQRHWYPTVFANDQVQQFIYQEMERHEQRGLSEAFEPFTLTVFSPEDSGSMKGWKIEEIKCPGKLARLTVAPSDDEGVLEVRTVNVKRFSISRVSEPYSILRIDGNDISLDLPSRSLTFFEQDIISHDWRLSTTKVILQPSAPSRLQSFLSGRGPITFVLPSSFVQDAKYASLGFRLAHDLHIYHRLDTELVHDHEIMFQNGYTWPKNNVVVIGSLKHPLVRTVLEQNKTPIGLRDGKLTLNHRDIKGSGGSEVDGIVFLHPHPTSPDALMMLIVAENAWAFERAARLFPIRTGIILPSWILLTASMDRIGAAGISGAGVWGSNWTWNEAFSWSEYL